MAQTDETGVPQIDDPQIDDQTTQEVTQVNVVAEGASTADADSDARMIESSFAAITSIIESIACPLGEQSVDLAQRKTTEEKSVEVQSDCDDSVQEETTSISRLVVGGTVVKIVISSVFTFIKNY